MATNGHDHLELVVLPLDDLDMRTTEGNNINNNNNNNINPVLGVWDYLLNAVFYSATSVYRGIILRYRWRLIEYLFLLKAVLSFILLVYVHMRLSQMPANYLDHLKDLWPRDGILRVEIIPSSQINHAEQTDALNKFFTLENSYKREYKLKRIYKSKETLALFNRFTKTNSPKNKEDFDIEPLTEELVNNTFQETNNPKPKLFNYLSFKYYIYFEGKIYSDIILCSMGLFLVDLSDEIVFNFIFVLSIDEKKEMFGSTTKMNRHTTSKSNFSIVEDSAQFCSTKYPNISIRGVLGIDSSLQSTSNKSPLIDDHELIFYESYIVEYSLEPGFLLMSPSARNKAGIPVMLVGLECTWGKYFGDLVDKFFLEYILGYNELLTFSVISLSKNEQYKGLLRNVITGEYYRFMRISNSVMLYIPSFIIMIILTLIISMILKYLLYRAVEMNMLMNRLIITPSFSDLLSLIIVALIVVASLSIMSSFTSVFFKYIETQYSIVLIIWVSDIYLTKLSRCPITKKHWPKFFYLYHFLFYAYNYRFNSQINRLTLYCSWSLIEHSMVYFYHRYEIPYALQLGRPQ